MGTVFANPVVFSDDFEDGQIDASKWVVGGRRVSWTPSDQGSWTWSHQEVIAADGYLNMNSQGPNTGNSYGATPWIRSTFDLNDGQYNTENFTWNVDVPQRFCRVLIQIVDGDNLPTFGQSNWGDGLTPPNNWLNVDALGTKNLLWSQQGTYYLPSFDFPDYSGDSQKTTWSITTDPSGTAKLFDGPDGTGTLLTQTTLDPTEHWYTRFMDYSGTSAGCPAGDCSFNLYSCSITSSVPEPSTFVIWATGAIGLLAYAWRRRRMA
jgi:MYXO-CTERM domain-containing protein